MGILAAASAAFGIVFLEVSEAVVGTSVVGLSRGWSGALLGAGVAIVAAAGLGSLVAFGGVTLPVVPLKLVAGSLLVLFGAYVLWGAIA